MKTGIKDIIKKGQVPYFKESAGIPIMKRVKSNLEKKGFQKYEIDEYFQKATSEGFFTLLKTSISYLNKVM